ncbi:hypothetical protein IWW50_000047 [Coemansia erecta]|nr:hypothetical protein IWW50_000047 [Coemansia erecta]
MVAQSLDLQCCSVPVDECEPGSDSSSAEQDAIPLINRFGSRESRESLYPTASFHSDELHMVAPQKQSLNQRIKLGMLVLAHAAIIGYLIALWQLLRNHISKPFAWHPVLMSVSLVLATESVIVMQFAVWPVPNGHTRPSRIFHYAAHTGSGIMQIIGIAQCVARRSESMGLASTGPTTHAIVGMLAALAFILQMAFGVYVAGIAPMLGRQKQGKQLYKYHRALGYVVLSLQWASAWLGVHSRWLQSKDAPGEWVWFFCFAALVVGILVPVDMSKFGFRQPA